MTDTWGDGWNGGTVRVSVAGVYVTTNQTLVSGFGPQNVTFTASTGQVVRVSRTAAGTCRTTRIIRTRMTARTAATTVGRAAMIVTTFWTAGTTDYYD